MKLHFWQFSQFKNWFFAIFEIAKNNFFVKLIYLISRVFFGLDFFKFSGLLSISSRRYWYPKPGFRVSPFCHYAIIPIAIPMYTDLFTCRNNIKRKRCLFHAWQKENATFLGYTVADFGTFSFPAGRMREKWIKMFWNPQINAICGTTNCLP